MRIAIIGAGPAGAMAGIRLARAGASVAVFDPSHPREKPCGGGLTGRALELLRDVIDIDALPAVVIKSATVEEGREVAQIALEARNASHPISLVVVSRAIFDRALVDAAISSGASLIPEKVIDVERRESAMVIRSAQRQHVVDCVIGADGANSLVRKKVATPFLRRQLSVAAGFFVHGVTSSTIAIRMMREQPGYLWSFPRPDHLAVGVCAAASGGATSPELRRQSRAWLQREGLTGTDLRPYAWPIPSVGYEDAITMKSAGPGWMLIGDAAGLVDPLTREGIYYAMVSGQWAADALANDPLPKSCALYAERVREEIQPELARAARLSRSFFSPAFASLLVRAIEESPAIRDVFTDLVTGVQPYRGLRRRLLATREWKLAGRVIRMLLTPAFASTIKSVVSHQET